MLTHQRIFSADDEGRSLVRPFIKNPSGVTTSGISIDLTFFGRYPAANYMADGTPNAFRALKRSTDGGLDHGGDKGSSFRKYLAKITASCSTTTPLPLRLMVMDYVGFYPLIGMEDIQEMDNTIPLPRYADGSGVQIMLVSQFPYTGGGTLQITYTNQDGVAGRVTPIVTTNTSQILGNVANSNNATTARTGIFIPLKGMDSGVQSIQSINFITPDTGNVAAVMVRPLSPQLCIYDFTTPTEWDLWNDLGWLPVIEDDAYISLVCTPSGSLNTVVVEGMMKTIWIESE